MFVNKQKKSRATKGNRFLISITVLGSPGPIRYVVNENELVVSVIDTALKSYAREGRLPVIGSNLSDFTLCCPVAGIAALSPWDTIGSVGFRSFMLCKKPQVENANMNEGEKSLRKGSVASWKSWFHKSLSLKISCH